MISLRMNSNQFGQTPSKPPFAFVLPVNSELLLVIRRPGGIILLGGIVGFMEEHVHQLEVNRPVDLQINCLLLLLKRQDVILNMKKTFRKNVWVLNPLVGKDTLSQLMHRQVTH